MFVVSFLCPNILSFIQLFRVFILLCPHIGVLVISSDQLQTLAQCSLDIGEVCYIFFKNYQLFFRIYSGYSGSVCESMSVHCSCRTKPHSLYNIISTSQYGPFVIGDTIPTPFKYHLHLIIKIHLFSNVSMPG